MLYHVTVSFGKDKEFLFKFSPSDLADGSAEQARRWLDNEFAELKCEPSGLLGKVLLHDLASVEAPLPCPGMPMYMLWHLRHQHDPMHRWLRAELELVVAQVL